MTAQPPPRTLVRDLSACVGSRILLRGFVAYVFPTPGDMNIVLRDHTGMVALDAPRGSGPDAPHPDEMMAESAIEVLGVPTRLPSGELRIALDRLRIVSHAASPLPLGPDATLAERLDWRFLDLREPRNRLVFEVQTTAERAMRALWEEQRFLEIHSPKLRPLPNKSGGELFAVEYFGRRVYLAQSPQWYKQMAMAAGFDRVFEIGPVFRPQREPTARHDTEFTSVDIELSWVSSMDDVLAHAEQLVCRVTDAVRAQHGADIETLFGARVEVPDVPFPRIAFADAQRIVRAAGHTGANEEDLDPDAELLLAEHVAREHRGDVVFVVDYPERTRPYYHMLKDDESGSGDSRSFDLLYRGMEIASGAQREHRYDRLVAQARSRGVDVDKVQTYLDFFKYGCPPHGGFGLGLSRLLTSMLGLGDVREATYVFRGPERVTP